MFGVKNGTVVSAGVAQFGVVPEHALPVLAIIAFITVIMFYVSAIFHLTRLGFTSYPLTDSCPGLLPAMRCTISFKASATNTLLVTK